MNRDYYVIACDDEGTVYSNGPYTWDEAVRNASRAMDSYGARSVSVIDAKQVHKWAEEVLADV